MAQTFHRINKSRKEGEVVDHRKTIKAKQVKTLDKYKNSVYDMIDHIDDEDDYDFEVAVNQQ